MDARPTRDLRRVLEVLVRSRCDYALVLVQKALRVTPHVVGILRFHMLEDSTAHGSIPLSSTVLLRSETEDRIANAEACAALQEYWDYALPF
jgi:hypothetical protein